MSITRKLKTITIRLLPFAILGLVIWKADLSTIVRLLQGTRIEVVGIGYLLLEVGILLRAIRWKILAREQNIIYQFRRALALFRIGWFTGVFLPQGFGAMAKIVYMQADGHPSAPSAASVVLERALDLVSLVVYGIAGIVYLFIIGLVKASLSPNYEALIVVACSFAFIFLLALYASKSKSTFQLRQRIKAAGQKRKIVLWFVKLWHALIKTRPLLLIYLMFMTLIIWMIHALSAYVLLKAIQIRISFILSMAIFAVAGLSVSIPISIDGVGLREGATFLLFRQLELSGEAAVMWAAMISATSLFSRLLGTPLLAAMPIPWKEAMKRAKDKSYRNI